MLDWDTSLLSKQDFLNCDFQNLPFNFFCCAFIYTGFLLVAKFIYITFVTRTLLSHFICQTVYYEREISLSFSESLENYTYSIILAFLILCLFYYPSTTPKVMTSIFIIIVSLIKINNIYICVLIS